MQILENISLLPYNTFRMDVRARHFAAFSSETELAILLDSIRERGYDSRKEILILGGGSNLLFRTDIEGFVLHNQIKGIRLLETDDAGYLLEVGAGENWHRFVQYCIDHDYAGLENLSLIPGNAGASPMQNIGAYGVELKDVFHSLDAWDLEDQKLVRFSAPDCEFGYRESAFKTRYRNRFIILRVVFRLFREPQFHISYGDIKAELDRMQVKELSIRAVSEAVIRIRRFKLPDPAELGNAGSFFKNPEVPGDTFHKLRSEHPSIVGYALPGGSYKLAAGWLIEQCGWKGVRRGDAGCHDRQALVLVNYGQAKGEEIYQLSCDIQDSVFEHFGVKLSREVNIIGGAV